MKGYVFAAVGILGVASAAEAAVTWDSFVIRSAPSAVTPVVPLGTPDGTSYTVNIDEGGEKAGYGTHFFDNQALSSVPGVSYTRVDPGAPSPYVNIWVTDGTHSAVIAPVANMQNGGGYTSNDVNGLNLQNLGFNIYETDFSDLSWLGVTGAQRGAQALLHSDGSPVLVSEVGALDVADPGVYSGFVGSGAPKNGDGFQLVFGDTQGNFVNPMPYSVANVQVPEPASLGLLTVGLTLLARRRRA